MVNQRGMVKEYYENGKIFREWGKCCGPKPEGLFKEYYGSGQLKESRNYLNGLLGGLYKEYYESGVLKGEWNFKDGKKEGIAREYFNNGQIKYIDTYKKDQRIDRKTYLDQESDKKEVKGDLGIEKLKDLIVSQNESHLAGSGSDP